jgi:hypothetical protein|tara:strand:- start:70 stop:624 length:555 start_codon:yes stop_codon:yes gene_type:complete
MTKSNTDGFYFSVTTIILLVISLFMLVNKSSNTKNQLQQEINIQNQILDSLKHKIDTLMWEKEIWDHNIENNTTHLLSAIMFVESSNNDSAYAANEDAVGCLQIRKCMVKDVNRILHRQKSPLSFTYDDRWSRAKSIKMFDVYCKHYGLTTAEEIARCWNGGPRGMSNEVTAKYWVKVKNKLEI